MLRIIRRVAGIPSQRRLPDATRIERAVGNVSVTLGENVKPRELESNASSGGVDTRSNESRGVRLLKGHLPMGQGVILERVPLARGPLINTSELAVLVAYALWLLTLYTLIAMVLQYAFGVGLPNPSKLLPSDWRHLLPLPKAL
jgi:hypothetical protein